VTAVTTRPSVTTRRGIACLPDIGLIFGRTTSDEGSQDGRDKEKDDVHDAERPTRLEHCTSLVRSYMEAVDGEAAEGGASASDATARGPVRAVPAPGGTECVDGTDKGSDEKNINEGHEEGVVLRAVVGEEGCDGPHAG